MVIGTIGTGINMFLVGVSIYTGNVTYMTLVYIFLYIMFFGFTLGPVMWVLLSEIFPNNVRDKAMRILALLVLIFLPSSLPLHINLRNYAKNSKP